MLAFVVRSQQVNFFAIVSDDERKLFVTNLKCITFVLI